MSYQRRETPDYKSGRAPWAGTKWVVPKHMQLPKKQMISNKKIIFFVITAILFLTAFSFAEGIKDIPPLKPTDRVLILAPHPDDETIGTAGVIQKAIKAGARVKVLVYTNGDNNELAFIVYEKRITFRRGEMIYMGEVRRKETVTAMDHLGVKKDDIIFLGYPDFGTMEILTKFWGKTKPFKSFFTRSVKVPYSECLSPGASYVGENILKDIKTVLLDFKPNKIFVSSPVDSNRDHRSAYIFLRVALWDLEDEIGRPEIFTYLTHMQGWPEPRGYHPNLELDPPDKLTDSMWWKLVLTDEEVKIKYGCIELYRSEIKYNAAYLPTFARKNELFADYPDITLRKEAVTEALPQGNRPSAERLKEVDSGPIVTYVYQGDDLLIRFDLKKKVRGNLDMSVFLLGYKNKKDFSQMPKIHISTGMFGLAINDKRDRLSIKEARCYSEDNYFIVRIPMFVLGDPDYILAAPKAKWLSAEKTGWRVIKIIKN